jgi:hypothetical protein
VAGSYEHCNELSSFIKDVTLLDKLNNYWHLKKDSAPWNLSAIANKSGLQE